MKRTMLIAICAAVGAALIVSGACAAQDVTFAFVDFQKFAAKSTKAQDQQKKFTEMVNVKRTALENKKKEMETLQEQLQKQGPMLKEDTRNSKIKELGIKEMELKLAEKEAQNSLQNEQREAQEVFRRDIGKIITAIRAEKKFSVIFDSAALLAAEDSLDITDEVARRYDAEAGGAKPAPAAAKPKPAAPAPAPAKPKAPAK